MHCEEINPKQPLHTTFPQKSTGAELFSTCLIVVKNLFQRCSESDRKAKIGYQSQDRSCMCVKHKPSLFHW